MTIAIIVIGTINVVLNVLLLVFHYRNRASVNERIDEIDWEIESMKENAEELATNCNDADKQINELLETNDELEGDLADVKNAVEEAHLKIDIVASREHGHTLEILPMLPKKREPN